MPEETSLRRTAQFRERVLGQSGKPSAVRRGGSDYEAFQCRKTQRVLKIVGKSEQN
jgi:hypothetical protein